MDIKGRGLHTTSRGLVGRADGAPRQGQVVFDRAGRRVGSVSDVFGPVNSPYFVVRPASGVSKSDLGKLIGSDITMGEMHGKSRKAEGVPGMRKR